jgi:hypothetical protein
VYRTNAEGPSGPTEDLDLGHVAGASAGPLTMATMIWHAGDETSGLDLGITQVG